MRIDTEYLVSAKTAEAMNRIIELWGDVYGKHEECSFEEWDPTVLNVMEKVIKLVHNMEASGKKDEFVIVGRCDSDYDCTIFCIEYSGKEPLIKASYADAEEDEDLFYQFRGVPYEEIQELLEINENRTFKQAIKDDLPLGGFLNVSYDKWVKSILGK